MQNIFDVAIFGGGVIGASIFNSVQRSGKNALLLELNDLASGESKANSGIIHAGFDAKEGTLKAKFNVLGSKLYPEICKRLGVPCKKVGAFVLGNDIDVINTLYNRGLNNGLKKTELKILNKEELKEKIPNVNENINYGLFAKNSAIVNPYLLTITLAEEAVVNGGVCETFFETTAIIKHKTYFEIKSSSKTYRAKKIINATGFGYNTIAKMLGEDEIDIEFKRGEYYVLDNSEKGLVKHTIFPLPTKHGKGVLITPTADGNVLVGPNAVLGENITKTTTEGLLDIKQKSGTLINGVNLKKAIRQFSGVRTIVGDDFVLEKSKKDNNIINIAGICSPGLSSAPAIALEVLKLLKIENKEVRNKKIKPYFLAKDLSKQKYNELVKKNKAYGEIICKCEMITKGDILFALKRPIPCFTVDGVKRRVRAGMGRCQGGFCMDKVAKIIANYYKIPLESIIKEYANSEIMKYNIE